MFLTKGGNQLCLCLWLRPAKSRNHAISDWGHKDTPGDTFWLAGIYFLGLVTF